jgi:hypothetical protein
MDIKGMLNGNYILKQDHIFVHDFYIHLISTQLLHSWNGIKLGPWDGNQVLKQDNKFVLGLLHSTCVFEYSSNS